MTKFKAQDVMRGDVDTGEKVIWRGLSRGGYPIYDYRVADGTYRRECSDPDWVDGPRFDEKD